MRHWINLCFAYVIAVNAEEKEEWEDNTNEWTGIRFGDSLRAAEDMERQDGIVAMSSAVS